MTDLEVLRWERRSLQDDIDRLKDELALLRKLANEETLAIGLELQALREARDAAKGTA